MDKKHTKPIHITCPKCHYELEKQKFNNFTGA